MIIINKQLGLALQQAFEHGTTIKRCLWKKGMWRVYCVGGVR